MIPKFLNWKSQWSGQSRASRNLLVRVKTQHLPEIYVKEGFPGGAVVKKLPANKGDTRDSGSVSGLGRSPRIGNSNPLQYSCLENSMDREAWWATIHVFTKSQTWLSAHEYSFPSVLLSKVNFAKHFTNIMFTYSPSDPMRPVFMILFYIWGYRFKVTSLERNCCNTVLPTTLLLKRQLRGLW